MRLIVIVPALQLSANVSLYNQALTYRSNATLQVALKIISKKALSENKEIANEVHALRELRHKNVMRMYDVVDTPNALVLVLELLDGGMCMPMLFKSHGRELS